MEQETDSEIMAEMSKLKDAISDLMEESPLNLEQCMSVLFLVSAAALLFEFPKGTLTERADRGRDYLNTLPQPN